MIRICSYNCNSLKNSLIDVRRLCDSNDIIYLQETWLARFELFMLNQIHDDFFGLGVSAFDSCSALLSGRPFGGIAMLWKKSLQGSIKAKVISDRIMVMDISTNLGVVSLYNVYFPTDYRNADSHDQFCLTLGQLACSVELAGMRTNFIGILGDFNANAYGSPFYLELVEYCSENGLVISDVEILGSSSSTYTYISAAHGSTSWLDHCICSTSLHSVIQSIYVSYDGYLSDHLPLIVSFVSQPMLLTMGDTACFSSPKLCWNSATREQVVMYNEVIREKIRPFECSDIREISIECGIDCVNESHIDTLSFCYKGFIEALRLSGNLCVSGRPNRTSNVKFIRGWNKSVKLKHDVARHAFLLWKSCGSPKEGVLAMQMRQTRLAFKYALRKCKREQLKHEAGKLAVSLFNKQHDHFWVLVKRYLGAGTSLPPSVGNVSGSVNIAEMWGDHFRNIFNDDSCGSDSVLLYQLACEPSLDVPPITTSDVCNAVKNLKPGKSAGFDNISTEHLLCLQPDLLSIVAIIFNAILNHASVPDELVFSLLTPLVKDKGGSLTDPSNYRAIALSTSLSKVLELILLERLQPFLHTSDAQFGFKADHSTTHATFILKETVALYTRQGSPVYACFLDASKAFDRVCHSKLFQILHQRGVPRPYLKLLMQWYRSQKMGVKWAESRSKSFAVTNGVRQGGNLSPLLFNVYIDDLLQRLQQLQIGCHVRNRPINVLAYADDIVLLSPSRAGLQKLIHECETFAFDRNINFNTGKTVCMVFNPKQCVDSAHLFDSQDPCITLNGTRLSLVTQFKYLGHVLEPDLNDSGDMRKTKRSLYYSVNMLRALVGHASADILMKLFKAYCTNLYGCELWGLSGAKVAYRSLCVAYHSCIKKLVGVPKSHRNHPLCYSLNILTCPMLIASRKILFYKRLLASNNDVIKVVLASEVGRRGILIQDYQCLLREYGLMGLDISAVSRMDLINVFASQLKRTVER